VTKSPPPVVNMMQCIEKIKDRLVTFIAGKKKQEKKTGDMIKKIT
jgi:hypothetical protein